MATATPARFRIPVRDPRLEELLLWRDPKRSGIAFGTITAAFLVLQFAKFNTIQWAAYLLAAVVLGCFVWNNFGKFFNKPQVPVPRLLREGVSEAQARATAEKATAYINKGLAFANRLALGREPGLTGAVVGALYALGRLAGTLSLLGLAYTAVLAAFTLPKVYELKHEEIDAAIDKARSQFTAFYDKHLSKVVNRIPRHTPAKPAYSTSERKEE